MDPATLRLLLPALAGAAVLAPAPRGQGQPDVAAPALEVVLSPLGPGFARTHVNATIFRRDPLSSRGDVQFAAYYDPDGHVVLARRDLGGDRTWRLLTTALAGRVRDAHNGISLMVDGRGVLHVAWNHHGDPLHYARGTAPGALELGAPEPMVGSRERRVTYPEFHRLASGDLLFAYRDGASGNGDLVLNRYDVAAGSWSRLCDTLLAGEGERNAYWQIAIDARDAIHVSWVWRRTPDVATNRDLGYACSRDGGRTWQRSDGAPQTVPITADNAEYALRIPEDSTLINQTSMVADRDGRPFIASYWRPAGTGVPQFMVVRRDADGWSAHRVGERTLDFELGGTGTRRVPMSRPRLLLDERGATPRLLMLFRDAERGDRATLAICADANARELVWTFADLTREPLDAWEPSIDTALWQERGELHVFVQRTGQGDGERAVELAPHPAGVLEVRTDGRAAGR
ncbi:MAG: BNR repeat-containing protein [Planctomycetes bacterium]|nr:BNR repeat-containing protein [Planctomycetota bacterium]